MFNSGGGGAFAGFGQANNGNNTNTNSGQAPQNTFGGFGGTMNNNAPVFGQSPQGTSGTNAFGGFGNTSTNQQTTTPAFGSFGQPAQQNGAFGFGSSNTASTPSFGTSGTGLFGTSSTTNAAPAFGAQPASGLFGSSASSNTFGSSVFSPATVTSNATTNGTANPAFTVQIEKEGAGGTGTNHFQSITCMPAYSGSSFEELRMQDYNQNRRYGTATSSFNTSSFGNPGAAGVFGQQAQSSPFGMPTTSNTASPFGQNNSVSHAGAFGTNQTAANSAFGAPSSGLFGANTSSNGNGSFGSNTTTNPIFGNSTSGTPSTPFGQATAAPFGAAQSSSSPFGHSSNNTNVNPFGQSSTATTTQKPFSFGSGAQGSNLFGQANGTTNTNPSVFGATNPTPNTNAPGTNFFGQSTTATGGSGLFGQSNAGPATNTGFSFGAGNQSSTNGGQTGGFNFGGTGTNTSNSTTNATPKPFSFGTPASGTSGTFGTAQNNAATKPFSFGTPAATSQTNSASNLFGQSNSSTAPIGSMFGTNSNANNLFSTDNSAANTANGSTSNIFSKPLGGSLFGGSTSSQPGQSLFGTPQNQTGLNNVNSGLSSYGNAQTSTNGFGQLPSNYGQMSQQAVDNNPYGANPLFSSIQGLHNSPGPLGPMATPLVSTSPRKKPAMLPHFKLPTRSPASSPRTNSTKKSNLYGQTHEDSSRKSQFSLFDEDLLLQPDAFSPRTNIKRLVIDRKSGHENFLSGELDLESSHSGPPKAGEATRPPRSTRSGDKQTMTPVLSQDQKESEKVEQLEPEHGKVTTPVVREEESSQTEQRSIALSSSGTKVNRESADQYWTSPSMATLLDYSKAQLSKVKDFKVGRRGYGQISFMLPVDLSTFETIEDVPGKIVLFESKMCTIYPEENLKPAPGKGLNVAATITLEHCYPLSKDKREPIRDPEHPRFQQHVDRLQRMLGTKFIDYLADTGTWIFKVDHF